jgi:hypothetical protein
MWTPETDKAVIQFLAMEPGVERNAIYTRHIHQEFSSIAGKAMNTFWWKGNQAELDAFIISELYDALVNVDISQMEGPFVPFPYFWTKAKWAIHRHRRNGIVQNVEDLKIEEVVVESSGIAKATPFTFYTPDIQADIDISDAMDDIIKHLYAYLNKKHKVVDRASQELRNSIILDVIDFLKNTPIEEIDWLEVRKHVMEKNADAHGWKINARMKRVRRIIQNVLIDRYPTELLKNRVPQKRQVNTEYCKARNQRRWSRHASLSVPV